MRRMDERRRGAVRPISSLIRFAWVSAVLLFGTSCLRAPEGPSRALRGEAVPRAGEAARLDGVSIERFEADRLIFKAEVESAELDRGSGSATGRGVVIRVFDREGSASGNVEERARVQAPLAAADLRARSLTLEGGVVIRDREGRRMFTERVTYDAPSEIVSAPRPVDLEGDNFRARGASLVGHRIDEVLEIGGAVSATVAPVRLRTGS